MMLATKYLTVALLAGHLTVASSQFDIERREDHICQPTLTTVTYVTAVNAVTLVSTVPRSCYTETITTKHHGFGCPTLSACGPHPDCMLFTTETVTLPLSDPCCQTTPTIAVQRPCPTCQKGCLTNTFTQYVTQETSSLAKKEVACTKTVYESGSMAVGPTKTVYALTSTSTISVSCGGCHLLTSNIGGLGPVITFTTTVTRTIPTTTTTWMCL